MGSKITVGKIVSTATERGWSQAYHAGGFTAVLSLKIPLEEEASEHALQATGKTLLDTLVSEYFTLTTKDLETVKSAVEATVVKIPEKMEASLIVAAVIKNVLYVVVANEGRALLKRGEKVGVLVEIKPTDTEKIASVSGFLETNDIVLLTTPAFAEVATHEDILEALERRNPEEIAETLAAKVHNAHNGDAAGLTFLYHEDEGESFAGEPTPEKEKKEHEENTKDEKKHEPEAKKEQKSDQPAVFLGETQPLKKRGFSHQQKLFLTIAIILAFVLIGSVVLFQKRQQDAKEAQAFQAVYSPAKTKYSEGLGLLDLNKSLAISDFTEAKNALEGAKSQFSTNSSEEKQLTSLLSQVTQSLDDANKVPLLSATKAAGNASPLLNFLAKSHTSVFAEDDSNFYTADDTGVTQISKSSGSSKLMIKNGGDWKNVGALGAYLGNIYLLDTKDGIDKYVSGSTTKSTYFSGTAPDLGSAISMTIDGSIWILKSDGTILKYTKGTADSFAVSGVDTPFKNPVQIMTTVDFDNVYILDKGNERVVVLKKDGSFVAAYASDTIRTADAMDISEKDKKIYLLSSGTVYQLDLK